MLILMVKKEKKLCLVICLIKMNVEKFNDLFINIKCWQFSSKNSIQFKNKLKFQKSMHNGDTYEDNAIVSA